MEANYVHKDSTTLIQDRFMKNGVFSLEYDKETLRDMVLELQEVINKAIEYINKYETIRGYYEYQECGYDEYNYEEDLKEELLDILKEVSEWMKK